MGIFDEIYQRDYWGFGSGHGSLPTVTKGYRSFLEMFLKENAIKSVVDYGCGDWQFSKLVNWGDASYLGLDIVERVISRNLQRYAGPRVQFRHVPPNAYEAVPPADLLIVKDVLQHMSRPDVSDFLRIMPPKFKYCLITNCVLPREKVNVDIPAGDFRPLDVRKAPFVTDGVAVYEFSGPRTFSRSTFSFFPAWEKTVILVQSPART